MKKVKCIKAISSGLTKGKTYTVVDRYKAEDHNGKIMKMICVVDNAGFPCSYPEHCFKVVK